MRREQTHGSRMTLSTTLRPACASGLSRVSLPSKRQRAKCPKASCFDTITFTALASGSRKSDAAAQAALLAVTKGRPDIYNITEDDPALSSEKAKRELGFDAAFRISS